MHIKVLRSYTFKLQQSTDVLVKWEDGTKNIVKVKDIRSNTSHPLSKGTSILMWWAAETGTVVDYGPGSQNVKSDSDDEDDVPLSKLVHSVPEPASPTQVGLHINQCETFFCNEEVWAACTSCLCLLCFKHFEESSPCHLHNQFALPSQVSIPNPTETELNQEATVEKSFDEHLDYVIHNLDDIPLNRLLNTATESSVSEEVPEVSEHEEVCTSDELIVTPGEHPEPVPESSACWVNEKETSMTVELIATPEEHPVPIPESSACEAEPHSTNTQTAHPQPEDYVVEGSQPEEAVPDKTVKKLSKHKTAKKGRNLGLQYTSMTSDKDIPARRGLKPSCKGDYCNLMGFHCKYFTATRRNKIQDAYFDTGELHKQRTFIVSHVKHSYPQKPSGS
ncbi:uncharacterized protein LOC110990447 [Acanthaster planci]|uniref:Uncharacterized protein LOC110990447 n=1 Tax=Acanthaster planci TaxID=133434 RepID=A0A8B8A1B3_ACAPL|nr:uncharacterized protein LOC110990447 [Acanthaster planci]